MSGTYKQLMKEFLNAYFCIILSWGGYGTFGFLSWERGVWKGRVSGVQIQARIIFFRLKKIQ